MIEIQRNIDDIVIAMLMYEDPQETLLAFKKRMITFLFSCRMFPRESCLVKKLHEFEEKVIATLWEQTPAYEKMIDFLKKKEQEFRQQILAQALTIDSDIIDRLLVHYQRHPVTLSHIDDRDEDWTVTRLYIDTIIQLQNKIYKPFVTCCLLIREVQILLGFRDDSNHLVTLWHEVIDYFVQDVWEFLSIREQATQLRKETYCVMCKYNIETQDPNLSRFIKGVLQVK